MQETHPSRWCNLLGQKKPFGPVNLNLPPKLTRAIFPKIGVSLLGVIAVTSSSHNVLTAFNTTLAPSKHLVGSKILVVLNSTEKGPSSAQWQLTASLTAL